MIYDIMNDGQRKYYEEFLEIDSFEIEGLARFRVNAFNHNRGAGAVLVDDSQQNFVVRAIERSQNFGRSALNRARHGAGDGAYGFG